MLCVPTYVEAELLELDSEGAIDRMSAVASDVDVHLNRAVLKNTGDGGGEPRFVRPTQWPRVAGCAARAIVSEVESAVLEASLSHLSTSTENLDANSAPNGDLAIGLTSDRGCTERVHEPDRLVVSVTERPIVVRPKRDQERPGLAWHGYVDERGSDRAFG